MRPSLASSRHLLASITALVMGVGCRSVPEVPVATGPSAEAIVEGLAGPEVRIDSIDAPFSVALERGRWRPRETRGGSDDFWTDVGHLDLARADRSAATVEERTFVAALRTLMAGDPDASAVAFALLHRSARDPVVRARARVGLTMALTWSSDWDAIAQLEVDRDSLASPEPRARQAAVERWARAFAGIPPATVMVPEQPMILPLRRSAFGTPVVTVLVNGRPYEFWLDTGASMTLLSADVARAAGVRLAATDTLALGVVNGHIDARAIFVDSLQIGGFTARGVTAAVVSRDMMRLDRSTVAGVTRAVHLDGVIGADLIRHMDLVLDAGDGTLTIRRPRRDPTATRNLFWVGYPVVRLVARDGQPLLFGLDTGAEGSYVTPTLLRKLPGTAIAARRGVMSGLGTQSRNTEWVARDLRVSDGDYAIALRNAPVAPEQRWTFVTFDGVIGSDVALATRLHLDFTNGVFDVRPSRAIERARTRPAWTAPCDISNEAANRRVRCP